MGLLDIFKKKEKVSETVIEETKNEVNMPAFSSTRDGRLHADFFNGQTTSKEFYDTTKLTIDTNKPFNLGGKLLYNCVVAWDGTTDCIIFGDEDRRQIVGNRGDYKGVWMELDLVKLQTDPEYCDVLMNKLLLRSTVYNLIEQGLKETPERPCGKYIGGISVQDGKYSKYFDSIVGKAAHESPLMVERRAKLKEKEQERKAQQIEANKRKIKELQAQNNELEN